MTRPDDDPCHPEVWEVPPQQVKHWLDGGEDMLLLDCRTEREREMASIEGAEHVPLDQLADRIAELREHEDRLIVVYCHHGRRSMRFTTAMRRYGFVNVKSMAGGIHQWSLEIDPGVPQYQK